MTVKELREQLERLEALGMENAIVFFRTENDLDFIVLDGVIDTGKNEVVLGQDNYFNENLKRGESPSFSSILLGAKFQQKVNKLIF